MARVVKKLTLLVFAVGLCTAWVTADELVRITVDPPRHVVMMDLRGKTQAGELISHSDVGFTITDSAGDEKTLTWTEFSPSNVYLLHQRFIDVASPNAWLMVGKRLGNLPEGSEMSDQALQVAVMLDETLAERVEDIRTHRDANTTDVNTSEDEPATDRQNDISPDAADVDIFADAQITEGFSWNDQSPARTEAALKWARSFGDEVSEAMGSELQVVETDHFLFFTDLTAKEAYEWQRVLDLMYERVSYLLNIPKGTNVFLGKAVVFLFSKQADFAIFEKRYFNLTVRQDHLGLCHSFPTGEVVIAFHNHRDKKMLRQTMIHESAHGVLHRYRSPVRIPTWLNEGIAEWTSNTVLNNPLPFKHSKRASAEATKKAGKLDSSFFDSNEIFAATHYGAALEMVEILLRGGRDKFVIFVDEIKAGKDWEVLLEEDFDMTRADLVSAYGKAIGMRNLTE